MAATTGPPVRRPCYEREYSAKHPLFVTAVYPLIYHSIPDEIPEASRPLITRLYQLWLFLLACLIVNMVACIFILIAGEGGSALGSSIGYVAQPVFGGHILIRYEQLLNSHSPLVVPPVV